MAKGEVCKAIFLNGGPFRSGFSTDGSLIFASAEPTTGYYNKYFYSSVST